MKYGYNLNLRSFLMIVVIVTIFSPVPVFSGGSAPEEEINNGTNELVLCEEPRPQVCTMDYKPVCGQLQDGSFKTYSNGCGSCSDHEVVGYREGECSAEK